MPLSFMEFAILFLFRVVSGAQNGFGYAKKSTGRLICTASMLAMIGFSFVAFFPALDWLGWAATMWLVVALIGTIGVEDSFNTEFNILPKSIHLWEALATSGMVLAWIAAGGNLIYILASVYPALIIHKGLINIGSGLPFFDERTDDRTGKTYTIRIPWKWLQKLLNREVISVPRMSTKARLSLAAISLLIAIINTSLKWGININDLL